MGVITLLLLLLLLLHWIEGLLLNIYSGRGFVA